MAALSREVSTIERYFQAILTACPGLPAQSLRRVWLRQASREAFARRALALPMNARLFDDRGADAEAEHRIEQMLELRPLLRDALGQWLEHPRWALLDLPQTLGALFESLEGLEVNAVAGNAHVAATRRRKRTGTFFTPAALATEVVTLALDQLEELGRLEDEQLLVCDPACGAGSFLIETARGLLTRKRNRARAAQQPFDESAVRRWLVTRVMCGADLDPTALCMAELSLAAFLAEVGEPLGETQLQQGDAVAETSRGNGVNFARWSNARTERGLDLVIGNPPWVAYAGRAAQPLPTARRAFLARRYRAFRGYPTLQAVFVERAAELAPNGVIALLVPSPLADLDGYRNLRRVVLERHEPCEPLLEFGEDAFEEVTQPCFALVARPRGAQTPPCDRKFQLKERGRRGGDPQLIERPPVLERLAGGDPLPAALFGELGFQSTRLASERLFLRSEAPRGDFTYPLLEGRDVTEFSVRSPRLFLRPDAGMLKEARCRLRPLDEFKRVRFVVRQTARAPIAALLSGVPFRNSLLAGFEVPGYPPEFVVGLLNSTLFRALHLGNQRDGRQIVFPQVKVGHLRALPKPLRRPPEVELALCEVVREASAGVDGAELRERLDSLVFDLYGLDSAERDAVTSFLRERAATLAPRVSEKL